MSSSRSKRLSAIIRHDIAQSGVKSLVGVNETGSVMNVRVQALRSDVAKKEILLPSHAEKGRSLKEEIALLERALAEHSLKMKESLNSLSTPLLLMHTCFAFVTRMWEFAIILLLAELTDNSLFIVAFSQFLSSFAIFSLSPYTGKWLDESNRLVAMKTILLWKVITISAAYAVCMLLLDCRENDKGWGQVCLVPHLLWAIPITAAAAHLAFSAAKMSLEKDWVVTIASGDTVWLSAINSKMTQIDLTCQSVAPVLTGVLCFVCPFYSVACLLLFINMAASFCLYVLLRRLYSQCSSLAIKTPARSQTQCQSGSSIEHEEGPVAAQETGLLTCGCAGALISFSCLYMTVLSFGSIMIVYLRWSGMPDYYIGMARGLSSLCGFAGALVYPSAKKRFGLSRTGIYAIWFQVLFVFIAAAGIYTLPALSGSVVMVAAVLLSRAGLWLFDLCARQISQESIAEHSRGKVNGQWASLTSFFNFSSYALACIFSDPEQFWILTTLSFGMVLVAAAVFSASYCRPRESVGSGRFEYDAIPESPLLSAEGQRPEHEI